MRQHDRSTPYHERMRPEDEATVFVLREGSRFADLIAAGSAIVGSAPASGSGAGIVIDYEGNTIGAVNLRTFEERARNAAGRHFTAYPTVARMHLKADDMAEFVAVGRINGRMELAYNDASAEALARKQDERLQQRPRMRP